MKKTISLLIVPIVILSIVSGLLFNQLVAVQNENSEMKNDLFEANTQLEEERNASFQLESQIQLLEEEIRQIENELELVKNENDELQNQLELINSSFNVKITNISRTRWANLAGISLHLFFNITIQNTQANDVHDVILSVKMKDLNKTVCSIYTKKPDVIHAGESKEVTGSIVTNYNYLSRVVDSDFVATLKTEDTVLDEYIIRSTNNAKITEFSAEGPDMPLGDITRWRFNVTIENEGGNDITGMALVVKMRQRSMIIAQSTKELDILHIGEIQKIETLIEGGTELSGLKEEYAFEAWLTVSNGNIIIDTAKLQ